MTYYQPTDDDVQRGADALMLLLDSYPDGKWPRRDDAAHVVLSAALPAYRERIILALADEWDRWGYQDAGWGDWLRGWLDDVDT